MADHLTGEQPVVLDQRARFTWPIVVAVLGLGIATAGGIAQARDADECCKAATATLHQQELRQQRTEDAVATTSEALREIKAELRKLNDKLDAMRERKQ